MSSTRDGRQGREGASRFLLLAVLLVLLFFLLSQPSLPPCPRGGSSPKEAGSAFPPAASYAPLRHSLASGPFVSLSHRLSKRNSVRSRRTRPPSEGNPAKRSSPAGVEERLRNILLRGEGERYCLSSLAFDARRRFDSLSPLGRKLAAQILFRPTSNPDYFNGVNIAYPPDAEVLTIESGAFRVHYVKTGSQAATDEYAGKAASLMPLIHQRLVVQMGFWAPPGDGSEGGGDNAYDVYITDLPKGIAGFCSASGLMGSAWASYIVVDNRLSLKDDATATNLSTTLAHEYFHACQYAYDPAERTWWKEATAVWAQDQVFDDPNDYVLLLGPRFENPSLPLDTADGRTEYATCLFARYLTEAIEPDIVRRIWHKQAANRSEAVPENTLPAIIEALEENGGTLGEALCGTLEWMYRKENFEEGYLYPELTLTGRYDSYPAEVSSDGLAAGNLSHLSAHILLFERPSEPVAGFSATFDGRDSYPFHVEVLAVGRAGNPDRLFEMPLSIAQSGNIFIEGIGTLYDRAAVAVCNESPYTGGASYALAVATSPPAVMRLDKYELEFDTSEGTAPPPLALFLGNDGEGELDWTAETDADWLSLSPSSGTVPPGGVQALGVGVDVAGLSAELSPYSAAIVFRSPNAVNSPQTVQVTLRIIFASPHIQVSPHTVSAAFPQGDGVVSLQPLIVSNGGKGGMLVALSSDKEWLSLSRASIRLGDEEEAQIGLKVLASLLPMSDEPSRAVITLSSDKALNSPVKVEVVCNVLPPGTLAGDAEGGYVALEGNFAWDDVESEDTDLTEYFVNLDDGAAAFYLPFPLTFYGKRYTTEDVFYVSTNGFLCFEPLGSSSAENHSLPSTLPPDAVMAPFWTDFDLTAQGKIYGRVIAAGDGNGRFVVEYAGVRTAAGEGPFDFQVAVWESGVVEFRYASDMRGLGRGTIGVEGEAGVRGTTVAFDDPAAFPAAGTAIRLLPSVNAPLLSLSLRLVTLSAGRGNPFSFVIDVVSSQEDAGRWRLRAEGAELVFEPSEGEGSAAVTVRGSADYAAAGCREMFIRIEALDGFVRYGRAGVLLNVYEEASERAEVELEPGWNAVALPLFPRSRWSAADIFAACDDGSGGNPVEEIRLLRGSEEITLSPGQGDDVDWPFGEGALLFSRRRAVLRAEGDEVSRSLHLLRAGKNILWSPCWEGRELFDVLADFPAGALKYASPWEGGWFRPFVSGTGKGVPADSPLMVRSLSDFFLSVSK